MQLATGITITVASIAAIFATNGAPRADLPDHPATSSASMRLGAIRLQSAGVMHFSSDGTLFLADPRGAAIYAIDVADAARDTSRTGVRIDDVDGKIAAEIGRAHV